MRLALGTKEELNTYADSLISRENKGTDRDNKGVGWDMSIPLNRLYTETRRPHSRAYFPRGIIAQEIPYPFFYEVTFIDKTDLHAVRHFIAFAQNITSRLTLMGTSRKTDFRSRDIAKNNFSGIDISQGLDLEPPSLSPHFLLLIYYSF